MNTCNNFCHSYKCVTLPALPVMSKHFARISFFFITFIARSRISEIIYCLTISPRQVYARALFIWTGCGSCVCVRVCVWGGGVRVCECVCVCVCVCPGGGGGTHVYWQYRYVRPLRPPFHALPAVPKHFFFIARRSKAYLFHWPTRSYGTQLKSQFSRPPFHVKSQFPRPPFGEGPLVLKPLGS